MFFRLLPWEYAIRNLFRRPLRTVLTFVGLATVILLVFVVVGFIRGLESSLAVSGDQESAVVFGLGMGENLEYSSIEMSAADEIAANVEGIQERYGQKYVSPELYLGTELTIDGGYRPEMGLVRGVARSALLVRRQVEIEQGDWPKSGEVLVGRLAAAKLGVSAEDLEIGKTIHFEGREWTICGTFTASGAAFESEVWCRLDDLQQALKRQDLSLVAVTMASEDFANLELFCVERLDLELQMMPEVEYYATLQKDYGPVRMLAWLVVLLVSGAGVFAGLNTMYGAVVGRIREFAALQTIGYVRRALLVSLVQEGIILSAAASLLATAMALIFVNNAAVRFTMGAFSLRIDEVAVLVGCGVGLLLGLVGAIPPAIRALRMPIVDGLKAT